MADDTVTRSRVSHTRAFLDGFLEPFKGAGVHTRDGRLALRVTHSGVAEDWRNVGLSMRQAIQAEEKKRKAS